jgi:diguanylate cyclase (GGDEF)-like protein
MAPFPVATGFGQTAALVATSKLIDFSVARPLVIALALATLAIVGMIDYLTGYQISFSVFYLLPVGFAAWYGSRRTGYVFAIASSLTWYIAEIEAGYPYEHAAIPVWNALVRLAFFVIIASLLSVLKRRLLAEKVLARTDPLTGLVNGRMFREQLDHDIALSSRLGAALTVAYIDLDDFKLVNDTHGHAAGDALLMNLGQAMIGQTRRSDTAARLGGDEFALILPDTDFAAARSDMEKLARRLDTSTEDRKQGVTFSIGAVVIDVPGAGAAEVIAAADRLMYLAKNGGKNAIAIGRYSDAALNDVQVYSSGVEIDAAA